MENPFNSIENRIRHLEELLFKIIENQEAQVFEPVDKIGGLELAQEITGLKISTLYNHVHKNKIPFIKKGGKLYFSKAELMDWLRTETKEKGIKEEPLFKKYQKRRVYE
jgi:excisionase family DNA binding protein